MKPRVLRADVVQDEFPRLNRWGLIEAPFGARAISACTLRFPRLNRWGLIEAMMLTMMLTTAITWFPRLNRWGLIEADSDCTDADNPDQGFPA